MTRAITGTEQALRSHSDPAGSTRLDADQPLRSLIARSGTLLTSPHGERVLSAVLNLAQSLLHADGYAVWQIDSSGQRDGRCRGLSEALARQLIAAHHDGPALRLSFGEVLAVEDVEAAPRLGERRDAYGYEGIVSLLVVPLTTCAEASGSFAFYYRQPHRFTDAERQTAAAFGNMASAVLTTAALYDDQRRRHEQLSLLAQVTAVLGQTVDYQHALKAVVNLVVPGFADWCAVDLVTDSGSIERLTHAPEQSAQRPILARLPGVEPPYDVSTVVGTGKPAMLSFEADEMAVRADFEHGDVALACDTGLVSYMCLPFPVRQRRPLGAMTFVSSESGRRFDQADLVFAEDLVGRAALAVDNSRAYEDARLANELKDEFLATLSHELRTPLNAIVGYARMLESGAIAPERREGALRILSRNGTALTQIVEDLLDVSRIVSGKVRLDVQPVDLSVVVTDAVATTRLSAEAKGIALTAAVDPRAGLVAGDPDRLRQVCWNLLSNAVKFTRRGGHIQVRVERIQSHVEVTVSDTGIGLTPAFLEHVFDRFRQADGRFAREQGGLGLGLAISRHLVEMHGGTITAQSDGEGRGATFRVCIPVMLGARPAADDAPAALAVDRDAAVAGQLAGVRIVAVDDEEDALELLQDILEGAGASVTTVRSAAAAAEIVEGSRPDVFISDIGMAEMNGFSLLAQIRQSAAPEVRHVPAVALTACARSEDRLEALRAGFQMHLAKPIDPEELVAAVATLARRAGSFLNLDPR